MNLDQEFHELFYVPEAPKKSRLTDRSRVKGRVSKSHPEHYRYKVKSVSDGSKSQKEKKLKPQSSFSGVPSTLSDPPILQLDPNPSMFKVFATIRQTVMENKLRNQSVIFLRSLQGFNSCEENDDSDLEENKESPVKVVYENVLFCIFCIFLCYFLYHLYQ